MASIKLTDITFAYGAQDLFVDFSLHVDTDWKIGMIGRNGRGKTTLLRLLAGELAPQAGRLDAPVRFDCFPFDLPDGELAGEAVLARRMVERWELERELRMLQVEPQDVLDRPISTLSGGERTKLQLAALFARSDHFLLIDEPTDHLDAQGREAVAAYLNTKRGFMLVSHDRAFLDRCVDHIVSLNKTGAVVEQGNYASFAHNQALRDTYEIEKNKHLGKDIQRLEKVQKERRTWAGTVEKSKSGAADRGYVGMLSAKAMKRALTIQARQQRMIDEKKELLADIEYASQLTLSPLKHIKQRLVVARDLTLGYEGKAVARHINLELLQGERVAIIGKNGSGKSTFLRAVAGEIAPMGGELSLAPKLVISQVAQETQHLSGLPKDYANAQGVDLTKFLMLLRKMDFRRDAFEQDMASMSQGQKKKILLAASLATSAHIYLWDEPMNYVDVLSRVQIENLIAQSEATFLLVEHDSVFLDNIGARRVLVGGGDAR